MVSSAFEEEVRQAQKVAPIFRELQVASGATVLPIAPDTEAANFSTQVRKRLLITSKRQARLIITTTLTALYFRLTA